MRRLNDESGVGLVETLVAVAILGVTVSTLLAGVSTGAFGVAATGERVTAQNLARSQLEHTKDQPFQALPASYPTVTPPSGYDVDVDAAAIPGADGAIQEITVTVSRDGDTVETASDYKVDR